MKEWMVRELGEHAREQLPAMLAGSVRWLERVDETALLSMIDRLGDGAEGLGKMDGLEAENAAFFARTALFAAARVVRQRQEEKPRTGDN